MKVAIVILAGTEGKEALGRTVNALLAARECRDAGDEVKIIFDGAGVQSAAAFAADDHPYHQLLADVKGDIAGVCDYCAGAFQVKDKIPDWMPAAKEFDGHPSFRTLLVEDWKVLTF